MLFFLFLLFRCSFQFNLDLESPHVFTNDNGLFGFSVALHSTSADDYVLVGSPNAQTSQPDIVQGGALFQCAIPAQSDVSSIPVSCNEIVEAFVEGGNEYFDIEGDMDTGYSDDFNVLASNKSAQFLGVRVVASDDHVVVCSHRYEYRFLAYEESFRDDPPRQLLGRCLKTNGEMDDIDLTSYTPCDNNQDSGYESYGNCQAGTSIAVRGDTLVIGVPGRFVGVGGAFRYQLDDVTDTAGEMEKIPEPKEDTVDKYIGYSSAICDLDGEDYNGLEYVFGGPRGAMYKGEIKIYSSLEVVSMSPYINEVEYNYQYNFVGEQMGSYFGHSLTCVDVNGDGYDDLVVGAPWYTDYEDKKTGIPADTGRVYIYYGSHYLDGFDQLENPVKITGDKANSAFGFSLASAGDMNDDGYKDVFVGAPYYNDEEGAVFLYLGGPDGLQLFYSQIITPTLLGVPDIQTFGWSVSGAKDMDNNGYPDLAVGAYKSGHVAFIRSKSIIDVIPALRFGEDEIRGDGMVVEIPGTTEKGPGTNLSICWTYAQKAGTDAPPIGTLPVKFTVTLDVDVFPRVSFQYKQRTNLWEETQFINLEDPAGTQFCTNERSIFFDNSTQNVQPIAVKIEADVDRVAEPTLTSLILNQEMIREAATELKISSKCHPSTGICKVDMGISLGEVTFVGQDRYPGIVFGFVSRFIQEVTIVNSGTDEYNYAYGVRVKFTLPENLEYSSVAKIGGLSSDVSCTTDDNTVTCFIPEGGAINDREVLSQTFGIAFSLVDITRPVDLLLQAEVSASEPSVDSNTGNNRVDSLIEVKELAELSISGGSSQSQLPFNNQYTIINKAIGTQSVDIKHEYSVELNENALKSEVQDITVNMYWPQQVDGDGNHIVPLYNITVPEHISAICTPSLASLYPYQVLDLVGAPALTEELSLPRESPSIVPETMDCANSEYRPKCLRISCNIEKISRGAAHLNGFKVSLYAKVHEANLYDVQRITINSYAEIASVHDGLVLPLQRSASALTELYASKVVSRNYLWIIIGSIIGGLLFLLLIILILWKCDFFKRKQPPSVRADKVDEQIDLTNM